MHLTFNVIHLSDCYEVVVRGRTLTRVSLYPQGSGRRSDLEWEDVPEVVQGKIVEEVRRLLKENS